MAMLSKDQIDTLKAVANMNYDFAQFRLMEDLVRYDR